MACRLHRTHVENTSTEDKLIMHANLSVPEASGIIRIVTASATELHERKCACSGRSYLLV
jgi:hypothetical protein